jgi:hypothetical protein
MAKAVQFQRILERLFRERADWLLNVLREPRPGAPPKFGRKKVDRAIKDLQQLASGALATKLAKAEFTASVAKRKRWHTKGWGRREKKRLFNRWYDRHIPYKRCVYVFWSGRHCIYVGKTKRGAGRPSSQFDKYWFNGISRIDIYALRGKRSLPSIECLRSIASNRASTKTGLSRPNGRRNAPSAGFIETSSKSFARFSR